MKKLIMATVMVLLLAGTVWAGKKTMSSSQSVDINAPASKVWAVLVDPNNWTKDNPVIVKSKLVKGDGESVGSVIKFQPIVGKRKPKAKLTISISEKHKKLEYTVKLKMPGFKGIMGFTLVEKNGVTTLTNYEKATHRFIEKFIRQEDMDKEHLDWVKAVKKIVESK